MSRKRKGKGRKGGRPAAGGGRPAASGGPSSGGGGRGASSPYLVPGLVLVAVVVALVAIGLTRKPPKPDVPDEPATPAVTEGGLPVDTQHEALRKEAIVILERVVDRWARDPQQPWLLMHGLLAWGPRHLTLDGRPAGIHMLDNLLVEREVEGRTVPVFPIDDPHGARIDAHIDQTVKTMIEMGIRDPRIDEIVAGAQWRFDYDPDLEDGPFPDGNEVPWSAQAFCQSADEGQETFVTHDGVEVDLRAMTRALVEQLEKESKFLDDIRQKGDTTYEKRRQGIFRYTCGGTHLFMGADACVRAGFGDQELSERLAYQMDLLFWRMRREIEAVDAALDQAPQMAPLLVEQRMKYLGHFLESEAKAELNGTFVPNEFHRRELKIAENALFVTVKQLQDMGVFDRLDTFKDAQYEYYLFTAGDACHALHALNLQDQLAAQRAGVDYRMRPPSYGDADEAVGADGGGGTGKPDAPPAGSASGGG